VTREEAMTATVDELRDWLAVDDGWNRWRVATTVDGVTTLGRDTWHAPNQEGKTTINFGPHPHPPTRDGAAAAMPEGWRWIRGGNRWSGIHPGSVVHWKDAHIPDTGDEIADRYRLAVLCRLAEREAAK